MLCRISGTFRLHVEQRPEAHHLLEVKDKVVRGIARCLRQKSAGRREGGRGAPPPAAE